MMIRSHTKSMINSFSDHRNNNNNNNNQMQNENVINRLDGIRWMNQHCFDDFCDVDI